MKLSIVIVTHRRGALLRACCESVQRAMPEDSEVIVIVNGPDRPSFDYVQQLRDRHFRAFMISEEPRAAARNRAFEVARGEILYFLDDDVVVPENLFRRALSQFAGDRELAVLGGPNLTPPDSTPAEKLYGAVMTSVFAAPMIRKRYTDSGEALCASEHELILCNLAFRRASLPTELRFRAGLRSNEENVFLFECRRDALKAIYDPKLFVFHRRRSTLPRFFNQVYSYGYGRAQQFLWAATSCHPAFFLPAVAIAISVAALFIPECRELFLFLLPIHLIVSFASALGSPTIRREGTWGVLLAVPLTGLVHLAYGLGFWVGIFNPLRPVSGFNYFGSSKKVPSS